MRQPMGAIATGVLTLLLAVGCQTQDSGAGQAANGDAEPAGARMEEGGGGGGAAGDREAIAEVNRRWREAALAGDADALTALYADDAVLLAPGMPTAKGGNAIRSAFAAMFELAPTAMTLDSQATIVSESGELAYDYGTYTMSGAAPGGESWQDTGKFLGVLRKIGGEWKYVADTWNSDAPPAM